MVKYFSQQKNYKQSILNQIKTINFEIAGLDENRDHFTPNDLKQRASLLDKCENLETQYKSIIENYDEMDYYEIRNTKEITINEITNINKSALFEKYCQKVDGVRINHSDGSNRIKYCLECNIEKILDITESAYICQCCGDSELIIINFKLNKVQIFLNKFLLILLKN